VREIERRVSVMYDVLQIEKYAVVRVAKDPDMWRKDQVRRNLGVEQQGRRFGEEYARVVGKVRGGCGVGEEVE
jgi:hypothetical protein